MLNYLAGYDRLDIASVEHNKEDYLALMKQPVKPLRIGIPRVPYFDHLDADVAKSIEAAIAKVASLTSGIKDVNLPSPRGTSGGGEMYAYHQEFFEQSKGLYQIPVRRNLDNGKEARAYQYIQASWKLQLLRRTIDDAFTSQGVDLMILPTRRRTPRTVVESIKRELSDKPRNPELENPADFNTFGIPALTLPCGFGNNDMPIGLMIVGPRFSEGKVLALAHAFEQSTELQIRTRPNPDDRLRSKYRCPRIGLLGGFLRNRQHRVERSILASLRLRWSVFARLSQSLGHPSCLAAEARFRSTPRLMERWRHDRSYWHHSRQKRTHVCSFFEAAGGYG
jgi:aspartyl-tRNA(Asn)/glutamyl-tRNA(Gln) amidotransferase subunit A